MKQRCAWGSLLAIGLCLQFAVPAHGLVTRLTPLKEVLSTQPWIFVAKVDKLDPDRPAMILTVSEDMKGKMPMRRLPVNLTGDSEAKKHKHVPALLKRLRKDLPLLVFASKRGRTYQAFVFTEGTWFQLQGQAEGDKLVLALTHGEPYLRRTFAGTTAELKKIIDDGLKNGKEPPAPDPKAKPGFGPELKKGALLPATPESLFPDQVESTVIPTVFLMGPLALLAALFPAVFGGLAIFMKRWLVLLSVACTNSTLFSLHLLLRGYARGAWWGSDVALWGAMTFVSLIGVFWSARRYRTVLQGEAPEENLPRKGERIVLWVMSGIGIIVVAWSFGQLLSTPWKELLVLWVGAWTGTVYLVYLRLAKRPEGSPVLPTELIVLWGMVFACANLGILTAAGSRSSASAAVTPANETEAGTARFEKVVWEWPTEEAVAGSVFTSPLAAGKHVYFGVIHAAGFSAYGVVYCVERDTGKVVWKFDAGEELLQIFSSPCLANGRLYFGEGLHENRQCRFYCLDAATGKKLWQHETASHVESSPFVHDGKVFFGAGDDGLYCCDAATGKKLWQFQDQLHIDSNPVVVGKRLFLGSGTSRTYQKTEMFCIDTATGEPIWRVRSELPVWGSPTVRGDRVYFGLGNGRFNMSAEQPKGAVVCVEADSGKEVWRRDLPDAVLVKPAVDAKHVYVGCRDHHVYALARDSGKVAWKRDMGSPVVASPALAPALDGWHAVDNPNQTEGATRSVYAVASQGRVACLDPATGVEQWQHDFATSTGLRPELFSTPAVIVRRDGDTERRRIFFGASLANPVAGASARVFCLEDALDLKK